jgi:16S rRNA (cytosine1402-N4)-methyltransferase
MYHEPVLLEEALEYLNPKAGGTIVDATMGGGGYTFAIARAVGATGKVIAIDADPAAIAEVTRRIAEERNGNVEIINDHFDNLAALLAQRGMSTIDGIVFDLGLSSAQLADPARGFSFRTGGGLDMSFGNAGEATTTLVNTSDAAALEHIIRTYGEERYAGRIAKAIVTRRPVTDAHVLAEIISAAVPAAYRAGRIHPATRSFQALRIATNRELERLESVLPQARDALASGGRMVVVSYHSLEDRIVKQFMRTEERACICPPERPVCTCNHQPTLKRLTKKAVTPGAEEIARNPRARSAKLRAATKI